MLTGTGNTPKDKNEGFNYKNLFATYMIGPLFIRNPYLTDYFVKRICNEKKLKTKAVKLSPEYIAYKKHFENK
jgi:CobQ-like glutamine amidotransferase family enzyme